MVCAMAGGAGANSAGATQRTSQTHHTKYTQRTSPTHHIKYTGAKIGGLYPPPPHFSYRARNREHPPPPHPQPGLLVSFFDPGCDRLMAAAENTSQIRPRFAS